MEPTAESVASGKRPRSQIALRDMLARVAVEIDGAAGTLEGFQDILSRASGLQENVPSEQLQGLDLLSQILRDLGSVTAALAAMQPVGDAGDAAKALERCKLSDLATRLAGGTSAPSSRDVELF